MNIKVGDIVPVEFEIVRLLEDGEIWKDAKGNPVEINNVRGNKFVGIPRGHSPNDATSQILFCSDP